MASVDSTRDARYTAGAPPRRFAHTLRDVLGHGVRYHAHKPFFVLEDGTVYTRAQVDAWSTRVANYLLKRERAANGGVVRRQQRVGVIAPNVVHHQVVLYAATKLAWVHAPVAHHLSDSELVHVLDTVDVNTLFVHPALMAAIARVAPKLRSRPHLVYLDGLRPVELNSVLALPTDVLLSCSSAASSGSALQEAGQQSTVAAACLPVEDASKDPELCAHFDISYTALLASVPPTSDTHCKSKEKQAEKTGADEVAVPQEDESGWRAIEVYPTDACAFFLTSGTTGLPKCAVHTHESVLKGFASAGSVPPVGVTLYNSFAWTGAFMIAGISMINGSVVPMLQGYNMDRLVQASVTNRTGILFCLPQVMKDLNHIDEQRLATLQEVFRMVLYGGGMFSPETILTFRDRFPNTMIQQNYGSTEAGMITTLSPMDHMGVRGDPVKEKRLLSCGRPTFNLQVRVVNFVDGVAVDCDFDQVGEVLVRGGSVFTAYFANEAANQKAFYQDYYRMGDLAYFDEEYYLYIAGRDKDAVCLDIGYNIFPKELETALNLHPKVKDSCVVGASSTKSGRGGELPIAFVEKKDESLTEEEVRTHLLAELAAYKQPAAYIFVDHIPHNINGKLDKKALAPRARECALSIGECADQ